MMDMLVKYCVVLLCLWQITCTVALELRVCNEWNSPDRRVVINCNSQQLIHIRSIIGGRKREETGNPDTYCTEPIITATDDCFQRNKLIERILFQNCNLKSNCDIEIPFLNMVQCDGFAGQKYFEVNYECWNREPITFYTMTSTNPDTADFIRTAHLQLTTPGYPNYWNEDGAIMCYVTLGVQSTLQITPLEIRTNGGADDIVSCSYRLYLNDMNERVTSCAEELWSSSAAISTTYVNTGSNDKLIQIAYKRENSWNNPEAKLWLQLQSFTRSISPEPNQGIVNVSCDATSSIWPRPAGQTSTSTSTTSTTTSTTSTTTTTVPTNSTISPTGVPNTGDIDDNEDDKNDSSFLPIIGGAAAGGFVVLLIIIIIIVLLVRRYNINHKPAKSLDVIDAWDDVSTLGKPKVMHQYSNGSNSYDHGSTTSTTIPYELDSNNHQHPYYPNGDMYAEIAVPAGVTSSSAVNNIGYIFEDDVYGGGGMNKNNSRSLVGSSHILAGSLDRRRVSDLYSKPNKMKKKPLRSTSSLSNGGFDHPDIGGTIYETAHQLDLEQDVYGYSTSLA